MSPVAHAGTHDAIIADRRPSDGLSDGGSKLPPYIFFVALVVGAAAALWYARLGLTLSHYDAKAHLVVARRIIDSLTPGWLQIGAVWLPLPHLLNALPVQIDACYRTGASGVAISIVSMAVGARALAALVLRETASPAAAGLGAALVLLNPNLLYLQSTPMTEPLLVGCVLVGLDRLLAWVHRGARGWPLGAGTALGAACLVRYEAWPIAAAAVALTGPALWRRGTAAPVAALAAAARLAALPALAIVSFLVLSRLTVGAWFVSSGFFVPENPALGRPGVAAGQVAAGLTRIVGAPLAWAGAVAAAGVLGAAIVSRRRSPLVLLLALAAAAALPWYAFLQGHPLRVRYMVPLVPAIAAAAAATVGLLPRRVRLPAAALVLALALAGAPPLNRDAAMVREAQWDLQNSAGRRQVTAYLARHYDGAPILVSMGSLAHYMQETSHAGFHIRHFVHEGNHGLWEVALRAPRPHVGWILAEERAEGGDAIARLVKENPRFLDGFVRVAEGGNVGLYRRIRNEERGTRNE
jgi:hypothetical protein